MSISEYKRQVTGLTADLYGSRTSEFSIQGISLANLESFVAFLVSPQKCRRVPEWAGTAINEIFHSTLYEFSFVKLN